MNDPLLIALLALLLGLAIGIIPTWLITRLRFRALYLSKTAVTANYVDKTLYEHQQTELDILKEDLKT